MELRLSVAVLTVATLGVVWGAVEDNDTDSFPMSSHNDIFVKVGLVKVINSCI